MNVEFYTGTRFLSPENSVKITQFTGGHRLDYMPV